MLSLAIILEPSTSTIWISSAELSRKPRRAWLPLQKYLCYLILNLCPSQDSGELNKVWYSGLGFPGMFLGTIVAWFAGTGGTITFPLLSRSLKRVSRTFLFVWLAISLHLPSWHPSASERATSTFELSQPSCLVDFL